ncbi:MAG: HEAT repeat domain-containing protein [Planctomycetota bacterium]|jgi:hypothetical protein
MVIFGLARKYFDQNRAYRQEPCKKYTCTKLASVLRTPNTPFRIAALVLAFAFAGCSKSEDERESKAPPSQAAQSEDLKSANQQAQPLIPSSEGPAESEDNLVQTTPEHPDREVDDTKTELPEDYGAAAVLAEIEHALADDDYQVREEAVRRLADVNYPAVRDILVRALSDDSEDVRASALEVALEHGDHISSSVMKEGISSQYADVKYDIVTELEFKADHEAVEILIEGLRDADPAFREAVNEALDFLIEKTFEDYRHARAWWAQNRQNFDSELFRIGDN